MGGNNEAGSTGKLPFPGLPQASFRSAPSWLRFWSLCQNNLYQPQAQGDRLTSTRDSQLDLRMLKRAVWVDTSVQAMLSSFLTN